MKFLRISSKIAMILVVILMYISIGILTYRFFLPSALEYAAEHLAKHTDSTRNAIVDARIFGTLWPISWIVWVIIKASTDYLFATVLSILMLASYNPLMYAVVKVRKSQGDKKLRKEQEMQELDEYLKSYGVDLPEE